jgi:hypothetical protein
MTREEAKEIAPKMCKDSIEKYGEDAIYVQSPCYGKCSWTYKEALESILNDTVLENTNENIIDSVLEYYEYLNKM